MEINERIKEQARKEGQAEKYFIYCMGSDERPKDLKLYKEGFKKYFGIDIPEGRYKDFVKAKNIEQKVENDL